MRTLLLASSLVLLGCGTRSAYPGAPPPPDGSFRDVVVTAEATDLDVRGAASLDDGAVAVLVCVRGSGGPFPDGGAIAKLDRGGRFVAHAKTEACDSARLVRAGNDLVVARNSGDRGLELAWTRFDSGLARKAEGKAPVAGAITAIAGRDDGAIVVSSLADYYSTEAGTELAVIGSDGKDLARARILGRDVRVSAIMPDGDGVVATGLLRGEGKLDELTMAPKGEAAFVLRAFGGKRWVRTLGAPGVSTVSYLAPRITKVGAHYVVGWSVSSSGQKLPGPDLEKLGGTPGTGHHLLLARLDAEGVVVGGRTEAAQPFDGILALQPLPDGSLLEHGRRDRHFEAHSRCGDEHGCVYEGGPEAYGTVHRLVVRRRDAITLSPLGTTTVDGEMRLGGLHVLYVPSLASIVALGAFTGTIDLPRGSVTSPRTERRDCQDGPRSSEVRGPWLASSPPPDPCQLRMKQHGALFGVRLSVQ